MALVGCPECGREISTAAAACPQCGHPMQASTEVQPAPPTCYACPALATTRCQRCGALSCARHLQSIYVQHGRGGSYELRCQSCYESAANWKVVGWVITGVVLVIFLVFFLTKKAEFDRKFDAGPFPHQGK